MKEFFTDYWKNGSRLTMPYLRKHWKGVLILNSMVIIGFVIFEFGRDIKKSIKSKFRKIFRKKEIEA